MRNWGLAFNPFEVRPLKSNERDMSLFVGREQEVDRVLNILHDVSSGINRRIGVLGQVGVGRSSFLNRILFELSRTSRPRCLSFTLEGGGYSVLEFIVIMIEKMCAGLLASPDLSRQEKKTVSEIRENLVYAVEYLSSASATITGTIGALVAQIKGQVSGKEEKKY